MFQPTIRPSCTDRRSTPILRFPIHRPAITPQAWPFPLVLVSPWERHGAEAGATAAVGVVTITSPSTTTTISTAIRTSKVATACRTNQREVAATVAEVPATAGNTTPSIAAALPTRIAPLRTSMVAPLAELPRPTAKQMRARIRVRPGIGGKPARAMPPRAGNRPELPAIAVRPGAQATGARTGLLREAVAIALATVAPHQALGAVQEAMR